MKSAHILRRQYLNLVDAFSEKKSILTNPAIRPVFPNPVTYVNFHLYFDTVVLKYLCGM